MDTVYLVSIHDQSPRGYLAFDLRDVLAALGDNVSQWTWWVTELDALGDAEVQSFCDAVESQGENGVWVTAEEFMLLAGKIEQTIEGKFFGFTKDRSPSELTDEDLNWGRFPTNQMQIGILAVDSSFFEVFARQESIVAAVRSKFSDVREKNPDSYFH